MSTVSTTRSKYDSYSKENVQFTAAQKIAAQHKAWACRDQMDELWNTMFDEVQEETGLNDEDTYLLIQRVLYRS